MNPRTCIVTGDKLEPAAMIRFVADPNGAVVADLQGKLPGRGVWVTAKRALVEKAVDKGLFSARLKCAARAEPDLAAQIERQLRAAAVASLSLANKAGAVVSGFAKVEAAARAGKAALILHAGDAAVDGERKIAAALNAAKKGVDETGPSIRTFRSLSSQELGGAVGRSESVHVAVAQSGVARALIDRLERLESYCGGGA